MADSVKIDIIVSELSKNPEFHALTQMIRTAENRLERDAIVKRASMKFRLLLTNTYPEE